MKGWLFGALVAVLVLGGGTADGQVTQPTALMVEGIPDIPQNLGEALRPYFESRSAVAVDWDPRSKNLLVSTRFGETGQLHMVAFAGGARRQITFESDGIYDALFSPTGDVLVLQKDVGGSEFFQLYTVKNGRLSLITDGKSRNEFGAFSHDGRLLGYTSTRRNGTDADVYIVDPRNPKTDQLLAEVSGGGWSVQDFSPDGKMVLVENRISVSHGSLYLIDVATKKMLQLTDPKAETAWTAAKFAPDGRIWGSTDQGSEVQRVGFLDTSTRSFHPTMSASKWDVEAFDLSQDGSLVAYVLNEAGLSKLHLLDTRSGQDRLVEALPSGVIIGVKIAPWGDVAVTVSSPQNTTDAFVVNPKTLTAVRWTDSETGGLDPLQNSPSELVTIKSFDGEPITGFLFRPNPTRFLGHRPLIIEIHGGPEGQERPYYNGRINYLINELGVAVFFPNVRGSTGFGKRFESLDNGPFRREDSVRDIGAFLDYFGSDSAIDRTRIGVTGGSYGGYMTLAVLTHYSDKVRAGIEEVGISNFVTFLENTQSYRRDLRRAEYGDERDPVQRAKLLEISPLTHADKIAVPLMVETGANDPRVPPGEAKQIIQAVRKHGGTVWSILASNEGHGFNRKENRDYASLAEILFWQKYLLK